MRLYLSGSASAPTLLYRRESFGGNICWIMSSKITHSPPDIGAMLEILHQKKVIRTFTSVHHPILLDVLQASVAVDPMLH